ncbi:MAG TPA: hypothetical protein VGG19_19420 [Tepidisphaeraceae bacterium]|jgi:hypothetical protein
MRASKLLSAVLVLAAASVASASIIQFDPDGSGPDTAVSAASFDWLPGDAMLVYAPGEATGTVYYQAKLGSVLDANGHVLSTPGLNAANGFEITAVFGIDVNVTAASNVLELSQIAAAPATNYFSVYYDTTQDANNLAGTGFRLSPTATKIYGAGINYALAVVGGSGLTSPLDLADSSQYVGVTTSVSSGGGTVAGVTTSENNAFFLDGTNLANMTTNGTLITPFSDVDPSQTFEVGPDGSTTVIPYLVTSINGDSGDVALESDAATSFTLTNQPNTPEPATLVLLPLAALVGRRRRA